MEIRFLTSDDAASLMPLLEQLGYPSAEDSIRTRLVHLLGDDRVRCWVADDGGRLVGLLTGHLSRHLEFDGPAVRLTALVVDERSRDRGVARLLMESFEDWALAQGATRASLTSSSTRDGAHAMYEHLGWRRTGVRFAKDLGGSSDRDDRPE